MIEVLKEFKVCPPKIAAQLARAGGWNRYGEPNYRVVWGWSRLTWIGGKWEDWEHGRLKSIAYEYRQVPKYEAFDRWHVEKWMPPEFYGSPREWEQNTLEIPEDEYGNPEVGAPALLSLGPYPARGDYEHSFTVQTPNGEHLGLTAAVVEYVIAAIERSRYLVHKDKALSLQKLRDRQAAVELEWERHADAVLGDAFDGIGQGPRVYMPGEKPMRDAKLLGPDGRPAARGILAKPQGVVEPTREQTLSLS
jgi:hypothetical protein